MYKSGEKAAWQKIRELGDQIPRTAGIAFEGGAFMFRSLGMDFRISPGDETIEPADAEGKLFLSRFSYFFNHLALWWLVCSRGFLPAAGRLVRPQGLSGAEAFFRGTHTLPLDGLARRYGNDKEGFIKKARALGGITGEKPGSAGGNLSADGSALLSPAPGFPAYILLWLEDEEFPARADMLLPFSIGVILPLDVIWCAAMLCLLPMF
ncbi:MAG: DUF3786 domain-containing protein [Nitrospiraceae bacterium]|nr:DUF3786 domain-containing protein [Nitrospiraceae bacterium]